MPRNTPRRRRAKALSRHVDYLMAPNTLREVHSPWLITRQFCHSGARRLSMKKNGGVSMQSKSVSKPMGSAFVIGPLAAPVAHRRGPPRACGRPGRWARAATPISRSPLLRQGRPALRPHPENHQFRPDRSGRRRASSRHGRGRLRPLGRHRRYLLARQEDRLFASHMILEGNDRLEVRGCIAALCKSQKWAQVS